MKYIIPAFLLVFSACSNPEANTQVAETEAVTDEVQATETNATTMSFYDLSAKTIDGEDFSFSDLKGKRVLIVNTASECGYTPQYEPLQELYDNYGGDEFTIIGFPANNFGSQEPGSDEQIKTFCTQNFGVTFPMMSKIDVKGENMHPVYAWLTSKDLNGVDNAEVEWNFNKFLIDEEGYWVAKYASSTSPVDEEIIRFASGS